MEQRERALEERAIRVTIVGNLGFGILGIVFALYAHSDAILLDGVYSFIGFAVSLLTLFVARLVYRPGDDIFPFGYAVFEPMLNLAKGLMITIVILFALVTAVDTLATGGNPIVPAGALFYAILATLGCAAVALVIRRLARRTGSPIVEVDAKNWVVATFLSAAVAIAFAITILLEGSRFDWIVPYVDPIMVFVLSAMTVAVPIRIITENWRQIAGMSPDGDLQKRIRRLVAEALAAVPCESQHLRIARLGRLVYLQLYLMISATEGDRYGAADQDMLREEIYGCVGKEFPHLAMDVVVTTDPVWAERAIVPA